MLFVMQMKEHPGSFYGQSSNMTHIWFWEAMAIRGYAIGASEG